MIRRLLVDDQAVVRQGLRAIMESHDDIDVAGQATDGLEAIAQVQELDPDVVMMDIRMPVLDGINATRRLVNAGVRARILILTTYGLDENVYQALMAGATGFILKTETPARLVEAVRAVSGGETLPETTRQLITRYLATSPPPGRVPAVVNTLTAREHEVMLDVAHGLSNQEIADHLYIRGRDRQDTGSANSSQTRLARPRASCDLRLPAWTPRPGEPGQRHARQARYKPMSCLPTSPVPLPLCSHEDGDRAGESVPAEEQA